MYMSFAYAIYLKIAHIQTGDSFIIT